VDPKKMKAVVDWRRPTSVHKIWCFLGLASYFRRFIEGFSETIRAPDCPHKEER